MPELSLDPSHPTSIHIVGVGGAGMSALAKLLSQLGHTVTGSDLKPQKRIQDEVIVNLQLGFRAQDDKWDVQFWARNLTDNQVNSLIFNSVFQSGSFSTFFTPPRMIGATLRTNF